MPCTCPGDQVANKGEACPELDRLDRALQGLRPVTDSHSPEGVEALARLWTNAYCVEVGGVEIGGGETMTLQSPFILQVSGRDCPPGLAQRVEQRQRSGLWARY